MEFSGLNINSIGDNHIEIDSNSKFETSRIFIDGNNNQVTLKNIRLLKNLFINLKGNNKKITIEKSNKIINNLKIVSIRGDEQIVDIGVDFSCGGCEVQMNDGNEKLSIGDGALFSWGIKIRTSDGHSIIDLSTNKAINFPADVTIGKHVWVGEDVKFLKGCTIPDNCVIGSGSIVTKSFAKNCENTIIAGIPAKIVKKNITWDRKMPYEYNKKIDG